MKKILVFFAVFVLLCVGVGVHSCSKKQTVVIYTSGEDYCVEFLKEKFKKKFTNFEVDVQYMSSSNITSKVSEEGADCEADIVFYQEYSYLDKIIQSGAAANLHGEYDLSVFEDDMITDATQDYAVPTIRCSSAIIVNNHVLNERGLEKPTSYADLLKPQYKGLISMPSPTASSTGYTFYLALVNEMGEDAALDYFKKLSSNVISFTGSGSGPVNALVAREAAIGLGMTSQAVEMINQGRTELEILNFADGAPFALYGTIVVKGKESKTPVMQVMDYLYSELINELCAKYYPEKIFKGISYDVKNFPKDINYCDMSGNTYKRKEELLVKWANVIK